MLLFVYLKSYLKIYYIQLFNIFNLINDLTFGIKYFTQLRKTSLASSY